MKDNIFGSKQIEYNKDATTWVPTDEVLIGNISWEDTGGRGTPLIVIDGIEISWHEFAQTILTHEGFQFKLEFIDPTEPKPRP